MFIILRTYRNLIQLSILELYQTIISENMYQGWKFLYIPSLEGLLQG